MSDLLTRARERKLQLIAQINELDKLILEQEALEDRIMKTLGDPVPSPTMAFDAMPAGLSHARQDDKRGRKRGPNGSPPDEIIEAATKAIWKACRSMTRYELVDAVEAAGLVVGGSDKARNMGTILWRSKAFDNEGDGYRPKGVSEKDLKDGGL